MSTGDISWPMVHRIEEAASNMGLAADRMESAARRIAVLFEDGYGGNGLRLIELMETKEAAMPAIDDVIAERRRQQEVEGWTPEHDDQHKTGEMPRAAGLYAISAGFAAKYLDGETETCPVPDGWPWAPEWWKPTNSRRDLVKAAALIIAEIERIDRSVIEKGDA